MAFAVGMRGGWDALLLIYFVGCGISRLARYNVTAVSGRGGGDKVKYFEGFPIPTSLLLVGCSPRSSGRACGRTGSRWASSRSAGATLHPSACCSACTAAR